MSFSNDGESAGTLDWAAECEQRDQQQAQQQQQQQQLRRPDMARYRIGALSHGDRPQQQQQQQQHPHRGGGGNKQHKQQNLDDHDLRHRLKAMNMNGGSNRNGQSSNQNQQQQQNQGRVLDKNDLRHRLNQRTADSSLPENDENGHESGFKENSRGNGRGNNRNQHRRVQGRGIGGQGGQMRPKPAESGPRPGPAPAQQRPKIKRNTENFNPCHEPCQMRILAASAGLKRYDKEVTSRDVIVVRDLFCAEDDLSIYDSLLKELERSGESPDRLWQSWHGDSHMIADDKRKWKNVCPTFNMIIDKIKEYFDMDVKATRLNWYRDSNEWKPFHHDAAAVKEDKARTQNFTVAVSFGMERDAAFEHAQTKTTLSMPQPNGTVYTFGKDVNIMWRHGILQCPPEKYSDQGRISIIAWGKIEQTEIGV